MINVETLIAADHPIRALKRMCDEVLEAMNSHFDEIYAQDGAPSIPPETLLKGKVLQALFTVRSDRQLCARLQTDLMFRWFVDLPLDREGADASTYSKNQARLLAHEVADLFFAEVVELAPQHGWVPDDHFSVDGPLIESWASWKSFRAKDDQQGSGSGNTWTDFRGEKRRNDTHASTTDPEAKLVRKGPGKEARLCFAGHAAMDNRLGLCVLFDVRPAVGAPESAVAVEEVTELHQRGFDPRTVGGDKGYHTKEFVRGLREQGVVPHPARKDGQKTLHVLLTLAHAASQKVRNAHRGDLRLGEDHRLLPQEPLLRRRAHARARPVCRGRRQPGADGEADARSALRTGAGVTPAGPAVRPLTAKQPENAAGSAARGAKPAGRSLRSGRISPECDAAVSKRGVFQHPARAVGGEVGVWLVCRFAPDASGSGIPQLKAFVLGERGIEWRRLLPVKFLAGWIGVGGGLALGREGPTIQMGGATGLMVSEWFRVKIGEGERKALSAAGAGAGLSAAFNAPLAGVMFVLEELAGSFTPVVLVSAFLASVSADIVGRVLTGEMPVFPLHDVPAPNLYALPAAALLGGLCGLARGGVQPVGPEKPGPVRATALARLADRGMCGCGVGFRQWESIPGWRAAGGLAERALAGEIAFCWLPLLIAGRFILTMVSYGTGAAGGIFAPLLVIGALSVLAFSHIVHDVVPQWAAQPTAFAVIGMGWLLTAIVRAPLTGIVLMIELTGKYDFMPPLLVCCLAAYGVAESMNDTPIYEALRERSKRLAAGRWLDRSGPRESWPAGFARLSAPDEGQGRRERFLSQMAPMIRRKATSRIR